MATYSWRQPVSGDFSVADFWTTDGVNPASTPPGLSDFAVFPGATTATVGGNGSVLQLSTTAAGSNWTFTGQIGANNLTIEGAATLSGGGRFTVSGAGLIAPSANTSGTLIVTAGSSYVSNAPPQTANDLLNVGSAAGSAGGLYVTGPGASVALGNNTASVGAAGAGVIAVSGGAMARFGTTAASQAVSLEVGRTGQGFVGVAGNGALLQLTGAMYAGRSGVGTVRIGDGGYLVESAVGTGIASAFGSGGTVNGTFVSGGRGYLDVLAGGSATFADGLVFGANGSSGFGTVQGTLAVGGPLQIGAGSTATGGTGYLQVLGGGKVRSTAPADLSAAYLTLGSAPGTSGTLIVDGPGSVLDLGSNSAGIGTAGGGQVSVSHGAVLKTGTANRGLSVALFAAEQPGSGGNLSITSKSAVVANGAVSFAGAAVASLLIADGSSLTGGSAASGDGTGANAASDVTIGGGTSLTGIPDVLIANGLGSAQVSNQSALHSLGDLDIGFGPQGRLTLTGSSSAIADGQVRVGGGRVQNASGAITVTSGSLLYGGGRHTPGVAGVSIGTAAGTSGIVQVADRSSYLSAGGSRLTVGDAGSGVLILQGGGTALAGAEYADMEAALAVGAASGGRGQVIVDGGSLLRADGLAVLGGTDTGSGVAAGGTGTITVSGGSQLLTGAMTIESGSALTIGATGAVSIGGDLANAGTVTNNHQLSVRGTLSGGGALRLGTNQVNLSKTLTDVGALGATAVTFGSIYATLRVHAVSGATVVTGFGYGDAIDIAAGVSGVSLSGNVINAGSGTITLDPAPAGSTYRLYGDAAGGYDVVLNPNSPPPSGFRVQDLTTGSSSTAPGTAYAGGLDYLQYEYIYSGGDSINVATSLPNAFIKTGSGADVLTATFGNNLLDAGGGSNILTGGDGQDGGRDTFIVDATGGGVIDTFVNFHQGDTLQIFGFVPGTSTGTLATGGASGYGGATIYAALGGAGTPVNASFTFAGLDTNTVGQHFTYTGGSANGSGYLLIRYT